jgi:hypothetical protein
VPRLALYRDDSRPVPRTGVTLEAGELILQRPDGAVRRLALDGCDATTIDAASCRRFVRMLVIENHHGRTVLITPPDRGAIAPRAVSLPEAPPDAAVVEVAVWEALVDWLVGGGRLSAFTVAELARLAAIASPQFAVVIGEVAARVAIEMVWEAAGPLRGGVDLDHALSPLVDAARHSPAAAEALVAALASAAVGSRLPTR